VRPQRFHATARSHPLMTYGVNGVMETSSM